MRTCLVAVCLCVCALSGAQEAPSPVVLSACEDASEWSGVSLVQEPVTEGTGAVLWDHGKSQAISLRRVHPDWKPFNELSFDLFAPEATGAEFMLIVTSEDDKSEGADYYSHEVKLDFKGWKHFALWIPADFPASRQPRGWDQIDRLQFTAAGWGNTPDPNTKVIIDNMRLSWEASHLGSRMTDAEFFGALDLDYPGLEQTRLLVEAGDLQAAKSAFVAHLKQREKPRHFVDWRAKPAPDKRPSKPNTAGADAALELRYRICGQELQFQDEIDWTANPTDPFNPEWTWQLGRFHWWSSLGRAYWETGDEKYARHFVRELRSWVQSNPMPPKCDNSVGSRWRTIECGIRLAGSWPTAFSYFLSSPSFTDDDVVTMVKSLAEQADYLHRYPQGGNWLTMEANGMGHVGILFPEFQRAATWRDDAIARLYRELDAQVYPDGPQKELTTGYHYVSLGNFLGLAEIAKFNEIPLPEDYLAKLERMWAMGLWAMTPDRTLPHVNDAWFVDVPRSLRDALKYFPERQDFRWVASDGKEGEPPDHTSHWFPWSGWAVMRSGWGRDDNYLFFDVGPFGLGHQHEDKLAFVIHACGKYLLTDVGSYAYDRSKMRSYVLSPQAHNAVLVDGLGQHRRGKRETNVNAQAQSNSWHSTEALDFCAGEYTDGFGAGNDATVTHKRAILFVKPDYWLVLDTLAPADEAEHTYEALFHLGTEDAVADASAAHTLGPEANLHIFAAGAGVTPEIIKGQEEPYYLGWIGAHGVNGRRPIPVARFTWSATGQSKVLYAFYPTKRGQGSPVAGFERTDTGDTLSAALRFTDGRRDTITIAGDEWRIERETADGSVEAVLSVKP